jgi:hypothetical protein
VHKSATKRNETVGKWCKNKHGASKIIDTLETYHPAGEGERPSAQGRRGDGVNLDMPGTKLPWNMHKDAGE